MNNHYQAGYRKAWAKTRKPLDVEESRYEAKHGQEAAQAFAEGWIDALEEA